MQTEERLPNLAGFQCLQGLPGLSGFLGLQGLPGLQADVQKVCQRGSAAELLNSTRITEFTYFYLEFVLCFSEQ